MTNEQLEAILKQLPHVESWTLTAAEMRELIEDLLNERRFHGWFRGEPL